MSSLATIYWLARAAILIWCVERRDRAYRESSTAANLVWLTQRRHIPTLLRHWSWGIEDRIWRMVRLPYPQGVPTEPADDRPCDCGKVD